LVALDFMEAKSDTSLFVYRYDADTVYLLLYVGNIILTASRLKLPTKYHYNPPAGVCHE
jgi:hypothetical protein